MADEGFRSDALRGALDDALAGRSARLEDLLCRMGAVVSPRPNFKLAAAFGAEIAEREHPRVEKLLRSFASDDAAPDTARAFLPIAAAFGFCACAKNAPQRAEWPVIFDLLADERPPVRLGAREALVRWLAVEGIPELFIARVTSSMNDARDAESLYGVLAGFCEIFANPQVLAVLHDHASLLSCLDGGLRLIEEAPRAASRAESYQRLCSAMPAALAAIVALPGGGHAWFAERCRSSIDVAARTILLETIVRLARGRHDISASQVAALRAALGESEKPPRDPTRRRPGQGRGKATRRSVY